MVKFGRYLVLAPLILAGCSGIPNTADNDINTPVSQQAVVGDARRAAKAHTDLGMVYLRDGQLDVAIDEGRKAVRADSSYPLAYNLLGLVQMYLKQNAAAEESFAGALQLAPGDPEINNNYGWFLCQTNRQKLSIKYFDVASRNTLYSTPVIPLTNAAMCAITSGDDKTGEEFLGRALMADQRNADALFLLAELYYRTGRAFEARSKLAEFLRMVAPSAQSTWLGLRIERKLDNGEAEARFAAQLRREFGGSREYQLMKQGLYQ
jgi:type IV pilus assembly protein PilF